MPFNSTGPHYCPECPSLIKIIKGREREFKATLDLVEENYHGTGADMAECRSCGKTFFVNYKVDSITNAETGKTDEGDKG